MLKRESIPIQSFEWGQAVERIVWKGDDLPQQIDKGMSSAVSLSAPLPQGKSHSRMLEGKYFKTGSVILGPRLSRQSLSPKKGGFVRDRANVIGHTHELGQHRKGVSKAEGPSLQSCVVEESNGASTGQNVLWCRDIASRHTALKIQTAFQHKNKQYQKDLSDVVGSIQMQDGILMSNSGRMGCMLFFHAEADAKKAQADLNFFASHEGTNIDSQIISKSQAKEIASAFCRDAEKDSDRREASNQAEVIAGTTAADEARQIGSSLNTHAHDKSDHEMQGAFCNGRQHYTQSAGSLQSAAIGQSDSDLKTPSHRKRHKKVELRALVPNTTAFSYFLVSYDPNRASIQVDFVANGKTHLLWDRAITDVSIEPTQKGGHVKMMTDGVEGLQFCGRQWIEFASLGKTAALMQQALDRYMINPVALERYTNQYTNLQEPITRSYNASSSRSTVATPAHYSDGPQQMDISSCQLGEIVEELSSLPTHTKVQRNECEERRRLVVGQDLDSTPLQQPVGRSRTEHVLRIVSDIAAKMESQDLDEIDWIDLLDANPNNARCVSASKSISMKKESEDAKEAIAKETLMCMHFPSSSEAVRNDSEAVSDWSNLNPADFKQKHRKRNGSANSQRKEVWDLRDAIKPSSPLPQDIKLLRCPVSVERQNPDLVASSSPTCLKPRKHKIVPPLKLPAAITGGHVDPWEFQTQQHVYDSHLILEPSKNSHPADISVSQTNRLADTGKAWIGGRTGGELAATRRLMNDQMKQRVFGPTRGPFSVLHGRPLHAKAPFTSCQSQSPMSARVKASQMSPLVSSQVQMVVDVPGQFTYLPSSRHSGDITLWTSSLHTFSAREHGPVPTLRTALEAFPSLNSAFTHR